MFSFFIVMRVSGVHFPRYTYVIRKKTIFCTYSYLGNEQFYASSFDLSRLSISFYFIPRL